MSEACKRCDGRGTEPRGLQCNDGTETCPTCLSAASGSTLRATADLRARLAAAERRMMDATADGLEACDRGRVWQARAEEAEARLAAAVHLQSVSARAAEVAEAEAKRLWTALCDMRDSLYQHRMGHCCATNPQQCLDSLYTHIDPIDAGT